MKLGRNGSPLFPRRLTKAWLGFVHDYESIHEEAHAKMREYMDCPWPTNPKTIDQFLEVCDARRKWETENNAVIPSYWNCILSHSLFEEIAREVKELRDAKRNT